MLLETFYVSKGEPSSGSYFQDDSDYT